MKKLISLLLVLAMALTLVACGGDSLPRNHFPQILPLFSSGILYKLESFQL